MVFPNITRKCKFKLSEKSDVNGVVIDLNKLEVGVLYVPAAQNFKAIDWFSLIYNTNEKQWYLFLRQSKNTVSDPSPHAAKDLAEFCEKMENALSECSLPKVCLLISPKVDDKLENLPLLLKDNENCVLLDAKVLQSFFGEQFSASLKWTLKRVEGRRGGTRLIVERLETR